MNAARQMMPPVRDASGVPTDRVHQRLVPWLRSIIDKLEAEEPLVLILSQVTNLGGSKSVTDFSYEDQPVEDLAGEIIMAAIDDMQGGGFRTEVAYSVSVDGKEERHNFTLRPSAPTGHDEERRRDYFPDMQGLTAQLMGQNLQLTDRALDHGSRHTELLMTTIRELREEIMYLKRSQYRRDEEIQKLMDGSLRRKMMYEEHESKMASTEKIADGVKAALPGVVAALAGPQAAAAIAMFTQSSGDGGGMQIPGLSAGPTDSDLVDELILRLEKNPNMLTQLFQLLTQDTESMQLLGELQRRSSSRREQRARAQQEAASGKQRRSADDADEDGGMIGQYGGADRA